MTGLDPERDRIIEIACSAQARTNAACAERTAAEDLPMREGVDFEPLLGLLIPGKEDSADISSGTATYLPVLSRL